MRRVVQVLRGLLIVVGLILYSTFQRQNQRGSGAPQVEQQSRSMLRDLRFSEGLFVVILGFALGFAGILLVHPDDSGSGEAFAALAAAVVGVGGALIGQATSIKRAGRDRMPKKDHVVFDAALIVAGVAAVVGAILLIVDHDDRRAAAATLGLAAVGVVPIHLRHERRLSKNRDHIFGLSLIWLGLGIGILTVLIDQKDAEAGAALGAAVLASGATLRSHARAMDVMKVRANHPDKAQKARPPIGPPDHPKPSGG
jgi:hypothetical protein